MKVKVAKIILFAVGFCATVLLLFPWCRAATYEANETDDPTVKYEDRGVEYETPDSVYKDHTETDQPPKGWYQDPKDFPIPEDWPDWVKRNFIALCERSLPERYAGLHRWAKKPLKANTKEVWPKASRVNDSIKITAPKGQYFTFFRAEPGVATLEQDFQGNAVFYNADDAIQYRVKAYSEDGYLGEFVTEKPKAWIKYSEDYGFRSIEQLRRIFQDKEGFYWLFAATGGRRYTAGHAFRLGPDGGAASGLYEILGISASSADEVRGGLLSDGRAVVVAAGDLDSNGTVNGSIQRLVKSPVWSTSPNECSAWYPEAVTHRANRQGYIYSTQAGNMADEYFKIDLSGNTVAWGNGGNGAGCEDQLTWETIYPTTLRMITDFTHETYLALTTRRRGFDSDDRVYTLHCLDGSEGATDGNISWSISPVQWFQYPKDICLDEDENYIYMVGWHSRGTMRPGNSESNIAKLDATSGDTAWVRTSETGVSLWSVKRCEESGRGFITSGQYRDSIGNKYLHIAKYTDDWQLEWSESFRPYGVDATGRDAIEADDLGFLAVGYADGVGYDGGSLGYFVKTRRYGESCSQGTPCK